MKWLLLTILSGYAAYAIIMVVFHTTFIYPFFQDDRVLDGFKRVELTAHDGMTISVQERTGEGAVLLYFMGNAGSVSLFEAAFDHHIADDRHIIALEYRGGGGRAGQPSEADLKADALVAADYAVGYGKPLIVQGFSLGTGLATYVAANRSVSAVILTAPYDRLCRVMSEKSFLPACQLPFVQKWNSFMAARDIGAPVLVLHGEADRLIAPKYSAAFGVFPNVKRRLVEGASHNDVGTVATSVAAISGFLKQIGL